MKRVKVNTAELAIGDVFYRSKKSDIAYCIAAQGSQFYACAILGERATCHEHKDVWIDVPRTTAGEFKVGEKITGVNYDTDDVFQITAVGMQHSLARCIGESEEITIRHDWPAREVKE